MKVAVKKGYGYWDLLYPWGGSFHRFENDMELPVEKVISKYNSGTPKDVTARSPYKNMLVGVTIDDRYAKIIESVEDQDKENNPIEVWSVTLDDGTYKIFTGGRPSGVDMGKVEYIGTAKNKEDYDHRMRNDWVIGRLTLNDIKDLFKENFDDKRNTSMSKAGEFLTETKILDEAGKWSKDVKTSWEPPEGLFTKSASEIASGLKKGHSTLQSAMGALNYYINRGGKDVSNKRELEKAKDELSKLYK